MPTTYTDICIYSYNSRGFGSDKQEICILLLTKSGTVMPIMCNKEHFLMKNNDYKIKRALPDYHIFFKQALMDNVYGRPKNRMFVAVPMEVKSHILDLSPHHWRVQAIMMKTVESTILVINTYFPTDPRIKDFDASDLVSTLQAI